MVKYCSRDCQVAHRPQHKKSCKKRAAELLDEELFKDPPERYECPICMLPLPYDTNQSIFNECCGKLVCRGCHHAQIKADIRNGKQRGAFGACAFCRVPVPETDEEIVDRLKRGVKRNDARSMLQLGGSYRDGCNGLQKDLTRAMELYLEAGKLGCADAYHSAGNLCRTGSGVEKDMKKAKHYFELGAIGGCIQARYQLACFEGMAGRDERGFKHLLICAKAGHKISMDRVKTGLELGFVTDDEYAEAQRAFQKHNDDARSAMRDEALVYDANHSLYLEDS